MSAVTGYYNPAGQGWRLAYSLVTLAHELASVYGDQLTCLGTVGDANHATENLASDHNAFILDPAAPSIGVVRAIDFGGPDALLMSIREHIWTLYGAQDPRVYFFGYGKGCSDNQINNWGLPLGHHEDDGDAGHLHISVTQVNGNNPSSSGYVAAIDSTAPWGFSGLSPSGGGTPIGDDMPDWFTQQDWDAVKDEVLQSRDAVHVLQAQIIGPTSTGGRNTAYTTDLSYDAIVALQAKVGLLPKEVAAAIPAPGTAPTSDQFNAILAVLKSMPDDTVAAFKEAL